MKTLTATASDFEDDEGDALMRRAAADDRDAFAGIIGVYQKRVIGFAARMSGGDTDAAQDIAQETFLRLWQNRRAYRPQGSLLSFLLHIAHNLCRDEHRRAASRPSEPLYECVAGAGPTQFPADSPDDALRTAAMTQAVAAAVAELPEAQRSVFVLSHYEAVPYREIALILDCPIGTVASRKYLAVEALRRRLKDWI